MEKSSLSPGEMSNLLINWTLENMVKSQSSCSTETFNSKAGVSPSPGLAVHSGTKHMVEAVADAVRQEVPQY